MEIIIDIIKDTLSKFSFYYLIGYILIFGFALFMLFYFKTIKDRLNKISKMDSFDKTVFILFLGILILIPSFFISLCLVLIIFFFYCIITPYISGQATDLFKPIFTSMTFIYIIYLFLKNKSFDIGWNLLKRVSNISFILSSILFIMLIVLAVLIIVFAIYTKCIVWLG